MIDETGQAGMDKVVQTDKHINAKGNNEQWQRQLEKAYFERQRAAMQSRDGEQPAISPQGDESGTDVRDKSSKAHIPETPGRATSAHHPVQAAVATAGSTQSSVGPANPTRTVHTPVPTASAVAPQNRTVAHARNADSPVAARPAMPAWHGTLPATSSASVLLSGQGVHLLIRDTSLSTQAARQLLGRLRALVAAEGQRLWAVTLNGERLWQAPDRSPSTSGVTEDDFGIDIQY